jgi:tRNA (cmo5U34)-methyltransferase
MNTENADNQNRWTEELTKEYNAFSRYFIPEKDRQMRIVCRLLAGLETPATILELCCGDGGLAEILLDAYPACSLRAYDGSPEMLSHARQRLARFGRRFCCESFDLAEKSWRAGQYPLQAVVSSLAIHHLPGVQKLELFRDVFGMLTPGGIFVVADVVEFTGQIEKNLAAEEWDEAVRRRSYELDGNLEAFEIFKREGWNMYRDSYPDDIDKPSPLFTQLKWLEEAGFYRIGVHWMLSGFTVFSAQKPAA